MTQLSNERPSLEPGSVGQMCECQSYASTSLSVCVCVFTQREVQFWFATGGAGFCLSRRLAEKMVPWARYLKSKLILTALHTDT